MQQAPRHPRELIKYLRGVRGYQVEEVESGIYHVSGDYLPIQFIECQKLTGADNLWLKGLSKNLKREEADSILKEREKRYAWTRILTRCSTRIRKPFRRW